MAKIVNCWMVGPPVTTIPGTDGPAHTAVFHAEVDEPLVGDHVIWLAQDGPGGSWPSGSTRVPMLGHRLFWAEGELKRDQGQSIAAFAAAYPAGYADGGSYALDFDCQPMPVPEAGPCVNYRIQVNWRPPNPDRLERPNQLQQWANVGIGGNKAPLEEDPANSAPQDTARLARDYWVEYKTEEVPVQTALRVSGYTGPNTGTPIGNPIAMVMPNGEDHVPAVMRNQQLISTYVIATNVPTIGQAMDMVDKFENTINSDVFKIGDFTIQPYHATFDSARTGRPIVNRNTTYYRMEMRINVHKESPWLVRPAAGTWSLEAGGIREVPRDEFGVHLRRVALRSDGSAALDPPTDQHEDVYSIYRPAAYKNAFEYDPLIQPAP